MGVELALITSRQRWGEYGTPVGNQISGQLNAVWSKQDMEQSEMMSGQEKDALGGAVLNSLGEPESVVESLDEKTSDAPKDDLPKAFKERLGRDKKRHQKELRELQSQIAELHNRMGSQTMQEQNQPANTYDSQPIAGDGIEHHINRAVNAALQAREQQERAVKDAEARSHVQKQYQGLQDHLDNASGKYEDFDDVVRGHDAPFSEAMRDAAVLLPHNGPGSAADVLYKLGKNKEDLKRISALHPLEQAKEMIKLSIALQGGESQASGAPRQLGNIKSNPVNHPSGSVNENTSVSELRRKLKAGWK